MKVLRFILIILVCIIALIFIVALFLPSSYRVERSQEIAAPVETVFTKASNFWYRHSWDPWIAKDSTATSAVTGPTMAAGSVWSWEGKVIGKGQVLIEEVLHNTSIHSKILFYKPMEAEAEIYWSFDSTATGTKAHWAIEGGVGYPMGRYFGLLMENTIGPDFENGLANLKKLCEEDQGAPEEE